jgi:phosphate-selective porin OprO and OprP
MMMKKLLIMFFLLPLLAGGKLFAQGCGDGPSDEGVNVFGFVQSQYNMTFEENHTENSFTFERVRLGVQGAIPYDFSYYAVIELSPFMDANRNPYLLDAFVTYNRFKWARVSVGSFKTPLGLETNTACNDMITIFRSTAVMQMVAPFRDMGMVFMGGDHETKIQYQLGLMNGSGLKRFDNNRKKDIVARLLYKPVDFLQIGGSFRTGYPSYNNDDDSRTTFGGEIKATYNGFTFMGEYIMDEGDYNRDLGGGCGGELITLGEERSGGWAAIAYRTKWDVEPVFKFDFFDSGNAQDYKETNLTFGVNYFFNDWTRLQVNYVYRTEEPTDFKNDRFVIQLQAKF